MDVHVGLEVARRRERLLADLALVRLLLQRGKRKCTKKVARNPGQALPVCTQLETSIFAHPVRWLTSNNPH